MHEEVHDSRQEARQFRENVLTELAKLADRVDGCPTSLERSIATSLDRYGAEMSQLRHDLQYAHSQDINEVVAKMERIVGVFGVTGTTKLTETRFRASNVSNLVSSANQA